MQNPVYALEFLIHENYYSYKYRLITPYMGENQESTKLLSSEKDVYENVPGNYYEFHKALKYVALRPQQISFLDIGCGTGRFVSVGIQLGFNFNRGIDLDKTGLEIAKKNAELSANKIAQKSNYEINYYDASLYSIPQDVNLIYLYNPFGEKTLTRVVSNIVQSAVLKPRTIYILYLVPTFELVFIKAGFECVYSYTDKTRKTISVLKLSESNTSTG